jgi:hypothetical protein
MVRHEGTQCLFRLYQVSRWKPFSSRQGFPHGKKAARKLRVWPTANSVRKLALKEGPFPEIDRFDRFLTRYLHAARTHIPIVMTIPVRRRVKLCSRSRPLILGESADPQLSSRRSKDQCWMWVAFCVQLPKRVIAAAIAEKHGSLRSWRPPNNDFRRTHEHSFRQDLDWD